MTSVLIIFLLTISLLTYKGINSSLALFHLKRGRELAIKEKYDNSISEMKRVENVLKNNGEYNFYLGSAYYLKGDIKNAIHYLEKSTEKSSIPNSFIFLGNCYSKLGNIALAEKNYITALYIQPSKLYTRYLLFELFKEKDKGKAQFWAKDILNTKIKTPTKASEEIVEEMREFLKE